MTRLPKSSHACPDNSADKGKDAKYGGSSSQQLKGEVTDSKQ